MNECKYVISGEAPESDEESYDNPKKENKLSLYETSVIGEARESDDEIESYSTSDNISHMSEQIEKPLTSTSNFINNDSLLQTRLWQSNAKFWKDLNAFLYSTISTASKELLNTDQQLLKSQVTLQSISFNFKNAEATTGQLCTKIKDVVSGNFIPAIKM